MTVLLYFLSPQKRILKTLKIIHSSCGNCKIFIRELTKKYEEKIITNISNLITNLEARDTIKEKLL